MAKYLGPISGYYGTSTSQGVAGYSGTTGYAGVSGTCGNAGFSPSSSLSSGLTYTNDLPILLEDFKIIELKKERKIHTFMFDDNNMDYLYE